MNDITLTFGQHNGKKLSECPLDYVQWLSRQATICGKKVVPQTAKAFLNDQMQKPVDVDEMIAHLHSLASKRDRYSSRYYQTHYSRDEIEAMRKQDELEEQELDARQEEEEKYILRWTAKSGQKITVRYGLAHGSYRTCFNVSVDGGLECPSDIIPVSNISGIVAKVGNVGLTQERYEALLQMKG